MGRAHAVDGATRGRSVPWLLPIVEPQQHRLAAALRRAVEQLRLDESEIAAHSIDVYLARNVLLRRFFWLRITMLADLAHEMRRRGHLDGGSAIDVGGGSGVVSAMLGDAFTRLTLVDRDVRLARCVLDDCGQGGVALVEADALEWRGPAARVGCVIAADVLEHFADLDPIVSRVRSWLADGGMLLTSLPTESLWYQALRIPFGKRRPPDHYHGAAAVERALEAAGFRPVARRYHPFGVKVLPLFSITAWRAP